MLSIVVTIRHNFTDVLSIAVLTINQDLKLQFIIWFSLTFIRQIPSQSCRNICCFAPCYHLDVWESNHSPKSDEDYLITNSNLNISEYLHLAPHWHPPPACCPPATCHNENPWSRSAKICFTLIILFIFYVLTSLFLKILLCLWMPFVTSWIALQLIPMTRCKRIIWRFIHLWTIVLYRGSSLIINSLSYKSFNPRPILIHTTQIICSHYPQPVWTRCD